METPEFFESFDFSYQCNVRLNPSVEVRSRNSLTSHLDKGSKEKDCLIVSGDFSELLVCRCSGDQNNILCNTVLR